MEPIERRRRADDAQDGALCPACGSPIVVAGQIVECPYCDRARHAGCFDRAGRCASPECERIPPPRRPAGSGGGRDSSAAVAALVVGVVGLACCPALAPAAVALGCVALRAMRTDPGLAGRGNAIAAIALGSLGSALLLLGMLHLLLR